MIKMIVDFERKRTDGVIEQVRLIYKVRDIDHGFEVVRREKSIPSNARICFEF